MEQAKKGNTFREGVEQKKQKPFVLLHYFLAQFSVLVVWVEFYLWDLFDHHFLGHRGESPCHG
jgi:hypothetical protein